jgi:c-di-GMP-binding flagellar brake protein YcgR
MTPASGDRAIRFAMMLPMRYRCPGGAAWIPGYTVNLSRSGVLFESESALTPGTGLEIVLELRDENRELAAVRCSATVVRQEGKAEEGRLAARFFDYRMMTRKNLDFD